MRIKVFALIALLATGAQATQLPYPTVSGLIDSQLPTNQSGTIQAAPLRAVLHDITDSIPLLTAFYPIANLSTSYTFLQTDQSSEQLFSAAAVAVTLSKPVVSCAVAPCISKGWWAVASASSISTLTITPIGSTINGSPTLTVAPGSSQIISTDGVNYFAVPLGNVGGGGSIGSFPVTVSGATTSGGVPYFNSATQMSSSAALAVSSVVVGGGAGSPPLTTTTGAGVIAAIGQAVVGSGGIVLATSPTIATPTLTSPIVTGALTATGLVTNADLVHPTVTVNTVACTLGASCTISAAASLIVGSSTITSGTNGNIEFNNAGVLGEKGVTGSGLVVEATGPTITGAALGTPTAIVLTNGTGLPVAGLSGLGTGIGTALGAAANASSGGITLQGSGGRIFALTQITNAYNVLATDYFVVATSASGVPTFPTAVGVPGQEYVFKNNSGSSITPATTSAQTIDGSGPVALANHGTLKIFSDGTGNWSTW